MFDDISTERILAMTPQELRWLENVKKAFYLSDLAYQSGLPQDDCLSELFKAIDTAKTLRRSLLGQDVSPRDNKRRFVEFIHTSVPKPENGGFSLQLLDARSGKANTYSFGELAYDIRCMVHENENLDAAEQPNYHILIDWDPPSRSNFFGTRANGRLVCSGHLLWERLREVIAMFITGIEASIHFARDGVFDMTCSPALGTIRPQRKFSGRQGGNTLDVVE